MLDKILELGTLFDWISPLVAAVQDVTNGPSHTFMMREDCGWSGREIANTLRRHGVKTWGHMIVNHSIMITVRRKQAQWAQYLLEREGIPIQYGLIAEKGSPVSHPARRTKHTKPVAKSSSWLDDLASLLDL